MKTILIITGIIVVVLIIILFKFEEINLYYINATNKVKLPREYESYLDIDPDNSLRFGNYEMKLMFKSFEPIRHFISSKNNLIVITSQIPNDRDAKEVERDKYGGGNRIFQDFTTYKLNKDGYIIDNYVFKRTYKNFTEILFGDYIVNIDAEYFRTWVLDGNALAKPFVIHNKDLQWNEAQQISLFQKINDEAEYYIIIGYNYNIGDDNPKQEIIYFLKNSWCKLFTNCILPDRTTANNQRGETTDSTNQWGTMHGLHYFQPKYFQRIKMERIIHRIGGNTPSENEIVWYGNLFCQLYVENDTFKFKIPMAFGEFGETEKFFEANGEEIGVYKNELEKYYNPYQYFTDTSLDFKLFTQTGNELYIIKSLK